MGRPFSTSIASVGMFAVALAYASSARPHAPPPAVETTAPVVETLQPRAAVHTPAEAADDPPAIPAGAEQCTAHDLSRDRYVTLALGQCPASISAAVEQWNPDVLVALGGGILPDGNPGCATTQRAWATYQLFERLGRRPHILLSGRGPSRPARDLDDAELRCARERRTRQIADPATSAREARSLRAAVTDIETSRRARLTEAEAMCAGVLRRVRRSDWTAVLDRMILETDSTSTLENVRMSTPMLVSGGFERVLVVSTFAFPPHGGLDNHPRRAALAFRAFRPSAGSYRVSAVACPYQWGGPAYSQFE